jgi:hypothetical protein
VGTTTRVVEGCGKAFFLRQKGDNNNIIVIVIVIGDGHYQEKDSTDSRN